jgi:hypothetical protein
MYLVDLRSNCPIIKMDIATQPNPARNPAMAPQPAVVPASFKNMPKLNAITNEKRNVRPKILAMFPFFMSSSEKLFSFIHIFPNNAGEYQSPPIRKFDKAATMTAIQLGVEMSIMGLFLRIC